jgi:hypothetical protein
VKSLEDIFLMIVFFEHLFFVVLGVMGTEGQETERFIGARKLARLLVGWEDSVVSLWASGKRMVGSIFLLLAKIHCNWLTSTDHGGDIFIGILLYFCFKF